MIAADYEISRLDLSPAGIAQCQRLLRSVFPTAHHITEAYLDWQYNRNPAGTAVGFNACKEGLLTAHYVTIPLRACVQGVEMSGLLSLNTATHQDHQGKKLFTRLAEATYAAGANAGYSFVVGVANANSTPGFVKRLGFQLVGPLEAKVGLGRVSQDLSRVFQGYSRIWTPELLKWRLSNPGTTYQVSPNGDRWRVEAATDRLGIKALLGQFARELLPSQPFPSAGLAFRPLTLWIGLDSSIRWNKSFYWDVPERFRPSPLNLIFRPLGTTVPPLEKDTVRLTAFDFDPY